MYKGKESKIRFYQCYSAKLFNTWSQLINRKDFKVTKNTKVCSNHFYAGKPTKEHPLPILYLKGYLSNETSERPPPKAREEPPKKKTKSVPLKCRAFAGGNNYVQYNSDKDNVGQIHFCNNESNENYLPVKNDSNKENVEQKDSCNEEFTESSLPLCSKNEKETRNFTNQNERPSVEKCVKGSTNRQTNSDPLREHTYHDQSSNETTTGCARSIPNPYYVCSHCSKLRDQIIELKHEVTQLRLQVGTLEEENKIIQRKRFTIEDIEHSDHLVKLYTGLQNAKVFKLLADKLRDKAARLHYARGSASNTPKYHQQAENRKKPGPDRKTSVEEEFFMTLVRLRQGLKEEDLAFRMKVSQSSVNRIVTTWISFLSRELAPLIYWPSGEEVKLYYPECFKTYPNVKAIIDCTEVYIQRPSLAEAQALTYSTYKSTNTWKTLVRHSW